MANTYRLVQDYTLVSEIQNGDRLLGQRVDGTTVRIPYQQRLVQDATPSLGGNLNIGSFAITSGTAIFEYVSGRYAVRTTDSSDQPLLLYNSANEICRLHVPSGSNRTVSFPPYAGSYSLAGQLVSQYGTGRTSHTAYALIAGGTSSTAAQQSLATGSVGQFLVSGGASNLPSWTSTLPAATLDGNLDLNDNYIVNTGTGGTLRLQSGATTSDILLGGTSTATLPAGTYTVAGTTVPLGGTGNASFTASALIAGGTTTTGALQSISNGSSGDALVSNGVGSLPSFQEYYNTKYTTTVINGNNGTPLITWGDGHADHKLTVRASGGGVALETVDSSATDSPLTLSSKGSGALSLNAGATGNLTYEAQSFVTTFVNSGDVTITFPSFNCTLAGQTVAQYGTGRTSSTAYAVICGGTTATGAQQSVSGVGTSGQVLMSNGGGALPSWQNAPAGTPATQSDQETATSTTEYVSPGRQQYHPSAAKAWAIFGITGNIIASYNVSSITDAGTGIAVVNFTTNFSSANYSALFTPQGPGTLVMQCSNGAGAIVASACTGVCVNTSSTLTDPSIWRFVAYGDQ